MEGIDGSNLTSVLSRYDVHDLSHLEVCEVVSYSIVAQIVAELHEECGMRRIMSQCYPIFNWLTLLASWFYTITDMSFNRWPFRLSIIPDPIRIAIASVSFIRAIYFFITGAPMWVSLMDLLIAWRILNLCVIWWLELPLGAFVTRHFGKWHNVMLVAGERLEMMGVNSTFTDPYCASCLLSMELLYRNGTTFF